MTSRAADIRALATSLAGRDPESLAALLRGRGISPTAKLEDFFDLAEALLSPDSIGSALALLPRSALELLAADRVLDPEASPRAPRSETAHSAAVDGAATPAVPASPEAAAIDAAGLARPDGSAFESVRHEARRVLGSAAASAAVAPGTPTTAATTHAEAEAYRGGHRAARGTGIASELVHGLGESPARELSRGGLSQPDARRLAAELGIDLTDVAPLLRLVAHAGLAGLEAEGWVPTEAGEEWLMHTPVERWSSLARAWAGRLPEGAASALPAGAELGPALRHLYPAGGTGLATRIEEALRTGSLLGLLDGERVELTGAAALAAARPGAGARSADTADTAGAPRFDPEVALAGAFPPEIQRVYLQHDLTIISPGALENSLERRLREFADLEVRAEASTYRMSETSLMRGLVSGLTGEDMLALLGEISLTGVPQPVHYLVTRTAERFGSIRVARDTGEDAPAGPEPRGTIVRTREPELRAQLLVDRSLSPLALRPVGPLAAASRFDPDVVFWALVDAKYPVVAEDEHGGIRRLRRRRAGRPHAPAAAPDHSELIERLRGAEATAHDHGDEAWLARRLGAALRAKETVEIVVTVPGRGEYRFVVEPTGIGGGRLRGIDRAADTERTFPLTSITRVSEVPGA